MEAGKRRLAGDTARAATTGEVQDLRREARALKEYVADLTFERSDTRSSSIDSCNTAGWPRNIPNKTRASLIYAASFAVCSDDGPPMGSYSESVQRLWLTPHKLAKF